MARKRFSSETVVVVVHALAVVDGDVADDVVVGILNVDPLLLQLQQVAVVVADFVGGIVVQFMSNDIVIVDVLLLLLLLLLLLPFSPFVKHARCNNGPSDSRAVWGRYSSSMQELTTAT